MYMDSLQVGDPFDLSRVLADMTNVLNNTSSRSIGGVSPNELVQNNHVAIDTMRRAVKPHLYWTAQDRELFFKKVESHIIADPGQYVRITSASSTFEKLSQRKYSNREMFQVRRVRFPIPADGTLYSMYLLEDSNHETIAGFFRTSEIIPVPNKLSPHNPAFRYHIIDWKREQQAGMVSVQYAGNTQKKVIL